MAVDDRDDLLKCVCAFRHAGESTFAGHALQARLGPDDTFRVSPIADPLSACSKPSTHGDHDEAERRVASLEEAGGAIDDGVRCLAQGDWDGWKRAEDQLVRLIGPL